MKTPLTLLCLLLLASPAFAQVPDGEPMNVSEAQATTGESPATEVSFEGAPGLAAKAVLVSNPETQPSLVIFHKNPGQAAYETILENANLNISMSGMTGNNTSLTVNPSGSLQILSGNEVGPARWERKLTVSYRNGQYSLTGFTLTLQDPVAKKQVSCDYNLLTHQGSKDGAPVTVKTAPVALGALTDGPMMTSCEKW